MKKKITENGNRNVSTMGGLDLTSNRMLIKLSNYFKVGASSTSGQTNRSIRFYTIVPLLNGLN